MKGAKLIIQDILNSMYQKVSELNSFFKID